LTQYIFPGGELDHLGMPVTNLQRHGFEAHGVESWQERCARTLRVRNDLLPTRNPVAKAEVGSVKTASAARLSGRMFPDISAQHGGDLSESGSKRVRAPAELPPTRADLYEDWPRRRCSPTFRPAITSD
jgi:cyclopropane-fatty-acyl-phospholipid synthase